MANYKVPQDVEADDKLLGPFSFRQFIYLLIVAAAIFIGWGLSRLFVPLAIIPLPIVLFFGALALPLRKDQPMEIYMAAIVSFYLKPRKRLWSADGVESLVEITAPKTIEVQRTKDLSQIEAEQRLSYLADIVDTGGWAVRGVNEPADTAMQSDAYMEAQQTVDILDEEGGIARSFDAMISQTDARYRQNLREQMIQSAAAPAPSAPPVAPPLPDPYAALQPITAQPTTSVTIDPYNTMQPVAPAPAADLTNMHVEYNPYPNAMHQAILQPLGEQVSEPAPIPVVPQPIAPVSQPVAPAPETTTSETAVSPDIINLAHNADLSIETIAHEAQRLQHKKDDDEGEVVISLR